MYAKVEKPRENKSRADANSVVQKKDNGNQGIGFLDNRPEAIAQRKMSDRRKNVTPPFYHAPSSQWHHALIQRVKVKCPEDITLAGGNGVSVLKQYSGYHVSIVHKAKDANGDMEVTNFHLTYESGTHIHWDYNGSTHFTFRGGNPGKDAFTKISTYAGKFGITLEKPQSVIDTEKARATKAEEKKVSHKVVASAHSSSESLVDNWEDMIEELEESEEEGGKETK